MKFSEDLDKGLVKFVSSYDFLRAFFGTRHLIRAEVLTYLIQLDRCADKKNGYFWVTHSYMANRLGYERHAISRAYKDLEYLNFIDWTTDNNNGTWVKLNEEAIEAQYLKFKEQELENLRGDGTSDTVGTVLQVPWDGTSDYSNK